MKLINFRISCNDVERIDKICKTEELSQSEFFRQAIKREIRQYYGFVERVLESFKKVK